MLKKVSVSVPPVAAGNEIAETGDVEAAEEVVQPEDVRATATRAYPVYAASEAVCEPPTVGLAVWSAMYRLVLGEVVALVAMPVMAVP
jgi:hypothetical protein